MPDVSPAPEPTGAVPAAPAAPAARRPVRVCVVCSGNICRSPLGEHVLRAALAEQGLTEPDVVVSSAGTGGWHVGEGAHPGTVAVLRRHGYPTDHSARQITEDQLPGLDLVLAADRGHLSQLRRWADRLDPAQAPTVALLRSFDPDADGDEVPDPWGLPAAAFDEVMAMTLAAVPGIVADVRRRVDARRSDAERENTQHDDTVGSPS